MKAAFRILSQMTGGCHLGVKSWIYFDCYRSVVFRAATNFIVCQSIPVFIKLFRIYVLDRCFTVSQPKVMPYNSIFGQIVKK